MDGSTDELGSLQIRTVVERPLKMCGALLGLATGVIVCSTFARAAPAQDAKRIDEPVVRLLRREPIEFDLVRVAADEEASSASHPLSAGGLSQSLGAEVDCRQRVVSVQSRRVFANPHLVGPIVFDSVEPSGWQAAPPRTTAGRILAAACSRLGSSPPVKEGGTSIPILARPTPPGHDPVGRGLAIQIASTSEAGDAQRELERLRRLLPELATLTSCVERAEVGGRQTFRALISGLAAGTQARRLCQAVQATGRGCFVRSTTSRPRRLPGLDAHLSASNGR